MKNILLSLCCAVILINFIYDYHNKPEGFRDIKLGSDISKFNLSTYDYCYKSNIIEDNFVYTKCDYSKFKINGQTPKYFTLEFYKNKLDSIKLFFEFPNNGDMITDKILYALQKKYGPPDVVDSTVNGFYSFPICGHSDDNGYATETRYFWNGNKINIGYEIYVNDEKINCGICYTKGDCLSSLIKAGLNSDLVKNITNDI